MSPPDVLHERTVFARNAGFMSCSGTGQFEAEANRHETGLVTV